MTELQTLTTAWINAKKAETEATEWRRKVEDVLLSLLGIPDHLEGTANAECGEYKIKIVGRMNRKVDADKLNELAREYGLADHIPALFRFKPELNLSAWKATDETITKCLVDAITTSPGRPSFSITKEQ
jgi:hypothetical protein